MDKKTDTPKKKFKWQEEREAFVKIVVVRDKIVRWYDETGILYIGVEDFLLNYINTMGK